ncbi:MAG: helix-turn-helix domain-containing protein [Desulfomonilaceae bacterium]|nr:helix-turn-helix domain-containing protein [Desulfomonilaceae bacterium]
MNPDARNREPAARTLEEDALPGKAKAILDSNIGQSLDRLVEYLVDNGVDRIHHLIMSEVEKRLLKKVLDKSSGNKRLAAKHLGMSRNTFHRKLGKLG